MAKSGEIILLPQYMQSAHMYERFLDAAHDEEAEIARAHNARGVKLIDDEEIGFDGLSYFYNNKDVLENEFYDAMCEIMSKNYVNKFNKIISEYWFDGRVKKNNLKVKKIMASVRDYLIVKKRSKEELHYVINRINKKLVASFDEELIAGILRINNAMLTVHVSKWLDNKEPVSGMEPSTNRVYCRRGVGLDELDLDSRVYEEWSYINSYSLAFSVTEKFSQMAANKKPAIVNTLLTNVIDRVLFFSPFIKGMPAAQLELGVIPHWVEMSVEDQASHGGINEYVVDYSTPYN